MGDHDIDGRRDAARPISGIMLLLLSALAFSTAGFFTRMAPVALWPMVFWRNSFGCVGLAALLVLRRQDPVDSPQGFGRRGWAAMICSAFATICYLAAFAHTSVADISIIYATAPMITAALAWLSFGERPKRRTLSAAVAALLGVAITVAGSASAGSAAGDGLAFLMTLALSGVAVLARSSRLPALATAFGSALLAALAIVPVAVLVGAPLQISAHDGAWLAVFGIVTMTVALPTYLAGAARVPAGRTMLISALEMPFAPLWVWLAFGEVPRPASIVGGIVVLAAVLFDVTSDGT